MARVLSVALVALTAVTALAAQRGAAVARHDLVGKSFEARIVRVADGDTLDAVPAGELQPIRLRLLGVDAPELGEVFSRDAQTFLRALVFDQRVRVEGRDVDRYNRLVARVTLGERDASVELLRRGLACHAYARDSNLAAEEAQARRSGRGFWAPTAKKPGCVERGAATAARPSPPKPTTPVPRVAAGYRGNVSTGVYHASWCPNATCRNCTRLFTTEGEAKAAGFKPAGDCLR